jgi:hypothetical protein
MGYRKFLIYLLSTSLIIAGLYSYFIYQTDPLGYYGVKEKSQYYHSNGRYQLPAFIKNLEYDTIIIGPSMSQNFDEQLFDMELKVKSFNASLSAASAKEQNYVYQLAAKTHKDLKNVYWEINFDSLYGESDRVNEDSGAFPTYLYNTFALDDVRYLFSYYAGESFVETLKAARNNAPFQTPYEIYKFGKDIPPLTVDQYKDTKASENNNPIPEGVSFQNMKDNFDKNILPMLKKHPDHQFKLYYTPYPITYHIFNYNRSQQAFIDRLKIKEYIFTQVQELENVEVYDFQSESHVTFTISNYLDGSHYFANINDWMTKQFAEGNYLQTAETTQENYVKLLEQVENFSAKQLAEQKNEEPV